MPARVKCLRAALVASKFLASYVRTYARYEQIARELRTYARYKQITRKQLTRE